jgi:hypothetical protein
MHHEVIVVAHLAPRQHLGVESFGRLRQHL